MANFDNPDILIIEDDKNDAMLIMRTLTKINLANNLVHLKDGAEALDFLFARNQFSSRNMLNIPKVILLDIKMPKVDGIQVLRQLKAHEIMKMIPVVMMTSSKLENDVISSYNLGVSSFVVKPVEFESFAKAVSEVGMYWLLINQPPVVKPQ
jgi:two-component system response regulator